jgi:hypothetical protein
MRDNIFIPVVIKYEFGSILYNKFSLHDSQLGPGHYKNRECLLVGSAGAERYTLPYLLM